MQCLLNEKGFNILSNIRIDLKYIWLNDLRLLKTENELFLIIRSMPQTLIIDMHYNAFLNCNSQRWLTLFILRITLKMFQVMITWEALMSSVRKFLDGEKEVIITCKWSLITKARAFRLEDSWNSRAVKNA